MANQGKRFPVETLDQSEVAGLLAACNGGATGVRNRALLAVLYRAGLRISEALSLTPKDLAPAKGSLSVLRGKGGKARVVGLDPWAWPILQRWLDRRESLGISARRPVFCTLKGGPIKTAYVRALCKRLGSKAGIGKRVHPHGLRHTHASELRQEGIDLGVISKQLGHSRLTTTARYLDHVAPTQVLTAIAARTCSLSQ